VGDSTEVRQLVAALTPKVQLRGQSETFPPLRELFFNVFSSFSSFFHFSEVHEIAWLRNLPLRRRQLTARTSAIVFGFQW